MDTSGMIAPQRTYCGKQPMYTTGTQKSRLLALLQSKSFVPLPDILALRLAQYATRIYELREDGYNIECLSSWCGRQKHSIYVLHGFCEKPKKEKSRLERFWKFLTKK